MKKSILPEFMRPLTWRWYERGERAPVLPCVFVDSAKEQGFTALWIDNEKGSQHFIDFVNNGPWTHWHPVSPIPK